MEEIARRSIGEPSRYTHKQCVTCEQLQSSKKTKQSLSFLASSSNIAISIVAQYMWSLWNSLSYASVLIAPMHVCVSAKRCGAVRTVQCTIVMLASVPPCELSSCDSIHTVHVCRVFALVVDTQSSEWASERSTNIQFNYTDSHAISSKAEAKTIVSCTQHNTCIHMCAELGRFKKWKHWFWYWTAFFDLCPYFGWNWETTEIFFTWDLAILCPERCQTWNPYLMFDRTTFQGRMELGRS